MSASCGLHGAGLERERRCLSLFCGGGAVEISRKLCYTEHQVAFSCQGVFSMSRIAAGLQRRDGAAAGVVRKGADGRTATGTAGGVDDLRIQHAGQCGDAGPLQRRDGHRSMAQSAAGPQRSGGGLRVRLEEPPVHGADHVLRDDALHHRPVTAAGWPFGWGCCWQALWERRRSRCTNSGKGSGNDPSAAIGGTFLIAETACRLW